jgi:hypothetical protein
MGLPQLIRAVRVLAMSQLTHEDVLLRLANTEDSTVERKTANDYRDCLKAAVGFSNSMPIGDPAVIFVGVGNDGTPQNDLKLDSLQKDVSRELSKIYPPIYSQMKVMKDKSGKEFLAIIVRGSPDRPHFAGQAYIRRGSETVAASAEQFDVLIAERNSKAREILKWNGKKITFRFAEGSKVLIENVLHGSGSRTPCCLVGCNQFFVTLEFGDQEKEQRAYPLAFIAISHDCENNRLELMQL